MSAVDSDKVEAAIDLLRRQKHYEVAEFLEEVGD